MRCQTPREVKVVSVIQVCANRGEGVPGDPIRRVTQYWGFDGELLAESDPETDPKYKKAR